MKLVGLLLALVAGFGSFTVNAQTEQTTPNLITNSWTGTTTTTSNGGGFSGGNIPGYNSSTNTVMFGYTTSTVGQTIAINNALSGSGVQIGGYNYSWQYLNNSSTGGTLSSTVRLTSSTGSTLQSYNYAMSTIADGWRTMSGTQNFNQQYGLADVGNLSISFTGKDARFWAGYYGPQVKDVNLSLRYTVDPCVTNPAYSPSCPNYNTVNTSGNLVPNPNGYAVSGGSIDQSYAINQALSLSGAGVKIHGFEWGYQANANGPYCASWFIVCWDERNPSVSTNVNITDSNNNSIYQISRTYQNSYNTTNYQYVFPSSRNLSTLGRFNFTASTNDVAYIGDMWSRALYTPDPCTVDPLSSQSCPGYATAFLTQQCNANPLYNSACPGYAAALFTQQCNANPLYNPSCPGYASAYLNYQCSINPLYSTTCSGYQQAYHDQQCSLNPLYATTCNGYAAAYKTQQCTANALYATDCPGYQAAYKTQQCTLNPLYATDCPGYDQAYLNSQCIRDSLYSKSCEGYATAYAIKYLVKFSDSSVSSSVNQSLSSTAATKANDPANTVVSTTTPTTSVSSDGSVSTGVSATGDTNVDRAIAPKTTSTSASPSAPVQLSAPAPAPVAQKQEEKKPEGKTEGGGSQQQAQNEPKGGNSKPAAPTARQELQARREAAAKAEAVEKGKNLANEMGKAADMEAQKQIQNVVIQAMGFTPGFDNYSKAVLTDVVGYKPVSIYNNQKNIDNRANLRMFGGTDRIHNEMVESQYNRGN